VSAKTITEGLGQIALAWNAPELLFGPGEEGRDLWLAQLLTRGMADISGLTVNVALNVPFGRFGLATSPVRQW
jgi:hypothetical protein